MKIVDYNEFIRLPAGTVFCPYEPCFFHSPLQIKTDTGWQSGTKYLFNGTISLEPSFSDQENLAFCAGKYEAHWRGKRCARSCHCGQGIYPQQGSYG